MQDRAPRLLVVDDERHIVDFAAIGFRGRGMEVRGASDGTEGLRLVEEFRPDVVVLDLMIPGLSGFEVCRRIRAGGDVPIIVLSARGELSDKVDVLTLGADDYLTKPFAFEELAARVVALLRRSGGPQGRVLRHADSSLDAAAREVRRNGRLVRLTAREFDLLHLERRRLRTRPPSRAFDPAGGLRWRPPRRPLVRMPAEGVGRVLRPWGANTSLPAHPRIYWDDGPWTEKGRYRYPQSHPAAGRGGSSVRLKDLSRTLVEELGGRVLAPGDGERRVRGLAVEEATDGWLGPDELAVSARTEEGLLEEAARAGAAAVAWRADAGVPDGAAEWARSRGLGLFVLPAKMPLRKLFSVFSGGDELLLASHGASRSLLDSSGERSSVAEAAERISALLGKPVVVEDPVGRLVAGVPKDNGLLAFLEGSGLRASRGAGVEETRRERRDRYARLPDGYLSVPVERWRVEDRELFWTPVGTGAPAGYLWFDPGGDPLKPEDVVLLYWARRALEGELAKDRIRLETELGVRGDFVDDLIAAHYGSVEILLQRARYLGADLSAGALVLIVDIDDFARYLERHKPKEPAIQELKRRLADAVRLQTRELFSNFLTGPRSDNVILLLAPADGEPPEDIPEKALRLAAQVQRYVKGLLPDLTVSVGIGRYKADPADLTTAYSEAEVALEIGHRIHGPSSVSTFEGTGTYKLLFRVLQEDPAELEGFYSETVEPAVLYDSRYGTELVHTLVTYLLHDASTVKTAGLLYAHRHTIRYRLDRVKELTGLDVEKSADRERLTLGIKAMQLLGRVPRGPTSLTDR